GVAHRRGSDLALPWLWCRPEATAMIRTLAWELPYAADVALKRQKERKFLYLCIIIIARERKEWRYIEIHVTRIKFI
ncbi:hypothetical protein ACJBPS_10480, partial [Streptococcus suis]